MFKRWNAKSTYWNVTPFTKNFTILCGMCQAFKGGSPFFKWYYFVFCSLIYDMFPSHGLHKFMWQMSQCNWGTGVSQTSHLNTSWPLLLGSILRHPDQPRGRNSERPKKKSNSWQIYRYDVRIIIMLHKSINTHFDELHLWLKTLYYDVIKLIFEKFFVNKWWKWSY